MPKPNTPRTLTSVLDSVKPMQKTAWVVFDADLLAEMEQVERDYLLAKSLDEDSNTPDQAPKLQKRLIELQRQAEASAVPFTFQSMGKTAWRALVGKHPPTKDQLQKSGGRADFNLDTLPAAAMAVCCIDPLDVSEEGFKQLGDKVTQGQWDKLWIACHMANTDGGDVPDFAAAFATVRPSATS